MTVYLNWPTKIDEFSSVGWWILPILHLSFSVLYMHSDMPTQKMLSSISDHIAHMSFPLSVLRVALSSSGSFAHFSLQGCQRHFVCLSVSYILCSSSNALSKLLNGSHVVCHM